MSTLDEDQINEALTALPGWSRVGEAITRTFDRGDFMGAVDFVNAIAPVAEAINHHPDVTIRWREVTLTLSTHSAGGLTAADFELARRIDEIA
jgi:4a-hydroxytetrahydrobiopterin dehydratase